MFIYAHAKDNIETYYIYAIDISLFKSNWQYLNIFYQVAIISIAVYEFEHNNHVSGIHLKQLKIIIKIIKTDSPKHEKHPKK